MEQIIVASLNPAKINAVKLAFGKIFPKQAIHAEGTSVSSEVSDQPMTDKETLDGALNRVRNAKKEKPLADYWIGLEGGIEVVDGDMIAFAWMAIEHKSGLKSHSRTSTFTLPSKIKELVLGGMELGHADDIVFNKENSKQSNGAVGLLTNDVITRSEYYEQALILALIPFNNMELYKTK